MSVVRGELEDLAFRYLEPEAFFALQKEISDKAPLHKKFLEEVQATIQTKLVEAGIPAELESRVKGLYSVHRKIVRQEISLGQVYDLLAVRVITDSERNCYAALGVVHHIWRPVPGRFKDYIAIARPNLYQSLHTTVLHSGQPFEVQIRTQDMHRIAEEGVAAHWKYKSGKPSSQDDDQRITWMRQLIEWSQELQEPGEFLSTLKVDLAPVEVYAFTPKGRVLELPRGATPVDFAYMVHTEVGHQCVGAKVNGQMVSLRHEITSGDVVEILTQKGHHPSRDWLSFVKSSSAKSKIRHWINEQEREEATEMGKRLLENEARHFGRSLKKIPEPDVLKLISDYGLSKVEDLYAAVGFGKYSARQVLTRLLGEPEKTEEPESVDGKPTLVNTVKRMLGFGEAPPCTRDLVPASRTLCTRPNAASPSNGAAAPKPLSPSSSLSARATAPAFSPKSPPSSAAPAPIFTISKAVPIAPMRALTPISKLLISASSKPSSSISKKSPAFSASNASTSPAIDPPMKMIAAHNSRFAKLATLKISFPRRTFAPRKICHCSRLIFRVGVSSGF